MSGRRSVVLLAAVLVIGVLALLWFLTGAPPDSFDANPTPATERTEPPAIAVARDHAPDSDRNPELRSAQPAQSTQSPQAAPGTAADRRVRGRLRYHEGRGVEGAAYWVQWGADASLFGEPLDTLLADRGGRGPVDSQVPGGLGPTVPAPPGNAPSTQDGGFEIGLDTRGTEPRSGILWFALTGMYAGFAIDVRTVRSRDWGKLVMPPLGSLLIVPEAVAAEQAWTVRVVPVGGPAQSIDVREATRATWRRKLHEIGTSPRSERDRERAQQLRVLLDLPGDETGFDAAEGALRVWSRAEWHRREEHPSCIVLRAIRVGPKRGPLPVAIENCVAGGVLASASGEDFTARTHVLVRGRRTRLTEIRFRPVGVATRWRFRVLSPGDMQPVKEPCIAIVGPGDAAVPWRHARGFPRGEGEVQLSALAPHESVRIWILLQSGEYFEARATASDAERQEPVDFIRTQGTAPLRVAIRWADDKGDVARIFAENRTGELVAGMPWYRFRFPDSDPDFAYCRAALASGTLALIRPTQELRSLWLLTSSGDVAHVDPLHTPDPVAWWRTARDLGLIDLRAAYDRHAEGLPAVFAFEVEIESSAGRTQWCLVDRIVLATRPDEDVVWRKVAAKGVRVRMTMRVPKRNKTIDLLDGGG